MPMITIESPTGGPIMTHNRPIFHCQCCGAVVVQEPYRVAPFCCGHEMVKAAEETTVDELVQELDGEPMFGESDVEVPWSKSPADQATV